MTDAILYRPLVILQGPRRRRWARWFSLRGTRLAGPRPRTAAAVPPDGVHLTAASLFDAYAASLVEVACCAEQLLTGRRKAAVRATPLQPLVEAAIAAVTPLAQACGLRVLHEPSGSEAACACDPVLLKLVLEHLILEALSREAPSSHVRVAASFCPTAARVAILSPSAADPDRSSAELAGAVDVLRAMDARLSAEPRRAGYLPLTLVLRTPGHAPFALEAA